MAHSIQSPAVDVFSLPPPKKTNLTVVPLSASSGSFVRCGSPYVSPLSDPPIPPTHTHPPLKTRLLELADSGTTVEFVFQAGGKGKNVNCWTLYRVSHLLISGADRWRRQMPGRWLTKGWVNKTAFGLPTAIGKVPLSSPFPLYSLIVHLLV